MGTRVDDERAAKRELLHSVPRMRAGVEQIESGEGLLALAMTVTRGKTFFDQFRPPLTRRRYELDAFGTFVVRQIDGRQTVIGIIDAFQERFRMSRRECELGVVAFLKMLMQRQAISVLSVPGS